MGRLLIAPGWVLAALSPQPPPTRLNGFLFDDGWQGFNSFDWLRAHANWSDVLDRHDWQVHSVSGGDVYYTRPGKAVRDGKSAVLHDDGPLVVFSTEVPETLEGLGHPTADGTGFSVSIVEFICAYEFNGEMATMGRAIAQRYGPVTVAPGAGGGRATATDDDDTPGDATSPLFPPPEFYDARPWLSACRQMAQASGIGPAAMVLAFMTRWATLIPPGFSIPAINGARSSFDLIGVVAGTSGSGKSSVMMRAEEMLPVLRKDLRMGLGIGSGEGIIESFYEWVKPIGEDGKAKARERLKTIAGVHFAIDEGVLLADLDGRAGTTHMTRLCTAWSGGALSTANASAEAFRHIDSGQYRLTAMMGIQIDRAHELMTNSLASVGFVGRLLFAWAEEPPVRPRPDEPDPLVLKVPTGAMVAGRHERRTVTYPQPVWDELVDRHDARRGTVVPVEEHHHDLLRLKVAGMFALMDDRVAVSMEDWALATTYVDCSAAIRAHLYAHRRWRNTETRTASALEQAEREILIDGVKERQAVDSLTNTIVAYLIRNGPTPLGQLRKNVGSHKTRHRFTPAIERGVQGGRFKVVAGRVELE